MTDINILQKIVDTGEINQSVNVIKIGTGIGVLTNFLEKRLGIRATMRKISVVKKLSVY